MGSPCDQVKQVGMSSRSLALGKLAEEVDRDSVVRALVVEHLERSYNLARLLVSDRALAEEATHEAVIRAIRAAHQLRDPDAFAAWFRRILVNCSREALKRGRDRPIPVAEPVRITPDPAADLVEQQAMAAAIATLSPEHREVVALRFYADLPVKDIAAALRVRPGTVKSRLHRALELLRAEYEAAGRPGQELHR